MRPVLKENSLLSTPSIWCELLSRDDHVMFPIVSLTFTFCSGVYLGLEEACFQARLHVDQWHSHFWMHLVSGPGPQGFEERS